MIGIYYIKNIINNTIYIGKSVDINRRFIRHKSELNKNCHKNLHLQRAYNKYGKDNFEFGVIVQCDKQDLNKLEIYYIQEARNNNQNLYNITNGGDGGAMPQYIIDSNKIKISKANKGNVKVANFGKNNGMYGKHHTEQSKHLMSIHSNNAGKNNPMYGKYGVNNPNYGKKKTQESKLKQSKAMLGKNIGNRKYTQEFIELITKLHNDGKSYAEIGRQFGKSYNTISNLIRFGLPAYPNKYSRG